LAAARIAQVAEHSPESRQYVAALLEVVADTAESHLARGALPAAERRLWEQAGARFDDTKAVARVHARAAGAYAAMLEHSEAGDTAVASRLNVDRSRISQRLAERSLYAVEHGDERYFPAWQFDGNKIVRGLKRVLAALDKTLHPLTVDHWFTTPNVELLADGAPMPPAEWLRTGGDVDLLVALAGEL
jgi:hypothetical protein